MVPHVRLSAAFLLLTAAALGAQTVSPACEQIRAITAEPAVAAAHWGISVTTLDGAPICAINAAQLFRPASNAKLFTTLAAMALLNPRQTVTTEVRSDGSIAGDTLTGDLRLIGAGDGFLSERPMPYAAPGAVHSPRINPLETLADAIVATHLKHITGDILGDDQIWPFESYPTGWEVDDLLWGYGAPVSALSVADNKLALTVSPGAHPGSPAVLTFEPATPWFTLAASVNTVPARSPARIGIERRPGSRILRVFGTVALGAPVSEDLAIDDPAEFAATTLRALLVERGVQVDGVARALHRDGTDTASQAEQAAQPVARFDPALEFSASDDAGLTILRGKALASISSPTLLDDITVTLKVSQNLHAELLLHRLGRAFGEDGSTAQGIRVVRQFWLNAGLNPADFTLFDGSGLSSHDLTTPRAVTQLLTYAARQPWFASFEAALPIGGVDGSLAARFPGPLKGRVFAKTGTLGESRALSGYINTSGGSTLIFSILVDNHLPASAADRAAMDRMVEKLASSP